MSWSSSRPAVQPSSQGRRQGGPAVWIELALDDGSTDEILTWATADGPGDTAPPPALALQFIRLPSGARARTRR